MLSDEASPQIVLMCANLPRLETLSEWGAGSQEGEQAAGRRDIPSCTPTGMPILLKEAVHAGTNLGDDTKWNLMRTARCQPQSPRHLKTRHVRAACRLIRAPRIRRNRLDRSRP